ncbi:Cytochrome P450 monooxygenase [Lachnellula suecica]|uniref:Cytochrome P450 monooxygenase n=1 Tax=Lachnellula suecica TaxID=602035 RepID=A0A8T9CP34_9HELO|nr:Cytochrome P450 monooxygenase [Lachnellula suecica]
MVPNNDAWSILTLIDKQVHLERRRVLSKALSDNALRTFEPSMLQHMDIFHQQVATQIDANGWSMPKNMSDYSMRLTFDIMCDFGFGQNFSLQTNRSLDYIPKVLKNYSWRMGIYEQYPKLANLNIEILAEFFRFGNDLKTRFEEWARGFALSVMDETNEKPHGQFSLIREFRDSTGKKFNEVELKAEGSFLILAGSETTGITMSAIFFYLAHNSDIYKKLATEVRSVFSDVSEICSGEKLLSCSYLSACVTETLRICPPVPGTPWREVEGDGIKVDTEYIPAGCNVGTSMYAIHHNETYFPSAYIFDPERWLSSSSEEQRELAHSAFNPFSLGPRGCAGRSMALSELNLLVARTMFLYDFRLADGPLGAVGRGAPEKGKLRSRENEYQVFANITSYSDGPWIIFKKV